MERYGRRHACSAKLRGCGQRLQDRDLLGVESIARIRVMLAREVWYDACLLCTSQLSESPADVGPAPTALWKDPPPIPTLQLEPFPPTLSLPQAALGARPTSGGTRTVQMSSCHCTPHRSSSVNFLLFECTSGREIALDFCSTFLGPTKQRPKVLGNSLRMSENGGWRKRGGTSWRFWRFTVNLFCNHWAQC